MNGARAPHDPRRTGARCRAVGEFEQTPELLAGAFPGFASSGEVFVVDRCHLPHLWSDFAVRATIRWSRRRATSFAPYVDVTATPQFGFEDPAVGLDQPGARLHRQLRPGLPASRAGAAHIRSSGRQTDETSTAGSPGCGNAVAKCRSPSAARPTTNSRSSARTPANCRGLRAVIDRYSVSTIDLDIEGDPAAIAGRGRTRGSDRINVQLPRQRAGHPLQRMALAASQAIRTDRDGRPPWPRCSRPTSTSPASTR